MKKARGRTGEGLQVHNFRTLVSELATATRTRVRAGEHAFHKLRRRRGTHHRPYRIREYG